MKKQRALYIILISVIFLSSFKKVYGKTSNFIFRPAGANFILYNRGGANHFIHNSRLTSWKLNKNLSRLASAQRINNSGDDPSGLAVADKMKGVMDMLKQESMNLQDYRNYLKFYQSSIGQNIELLKRIRVLILRSANGILSAEDRQYNQSEINQLLQQIDMNSRFSTFNKVQVIPDLTVEKLNLSKVNVVRNLYGSTKLVDDAMNRLLKLRSKAGVKSNSLLFQVKGKNMYMLNIEQAESRIRDADMASEISELMKNNTIYKSQIGVYIKQK